LDDEIRVLFKQEDTNFTNCHRLTKALNPIREHSHNAYQRAVVVQFGGAMPSMNRRVVRKEQRLGPTADVVHA